MLLSAILLLPLLLKAAEPDRLTSLVEEMRQLTYAGNHQAAGRLVPVLLGELAKPHPQAASGWNQIGVYLHTLGDHAGAEHAYQRGIQLVQKEQDTSGDLASLLLLNLASLYLETGRRPAHAELISRRALRMAIEQYGPASPQLVNFLCTLGAARQQQGDGQNARLYYQQALDLADKNSEGRLSRGVILASLGVLSARDKEWTQARDLLLQSIQTTEHVLGKSHPESVRAHINLARVYEHLQQWIPASANLKSAREITEAKLDPHHPLMVEILVTSASILRKTGHRREARDLSRRAKEIMAALPKDSAANTWIHAADLRLSGRQ